MRTLANLRGWGQWIDEHAVAVCAGWSFWLAAGYLLFGSSSFVRVFDNGDSYVPARIDQGKMLAAGHFAYWNPQWATGVDLLASGLSPLLDVVFFAVAPGWLAYGGTMWLQRFVAAFFTYRLLRDCLRLDSLPSLYAALACSLLHQRTMDFWHAAGFTMFDGLGLPALAFVLWALSRLELQHRYRSHFQALGLGLLLAVTAYFHFSVLCLPLIVFWFIFVTPSRTPRFWTALTAFMLGWAVASLPVLWATTANTPFSHRVDWLPGGPIPVIEGWTDQARYFRQFALENWLPASIVAAGLLLPRLRSSHLLALSSALALGAVVYVATAFVQIRFAGELGFMRGFDFSRIRNFFPFVLFVAASVALQAIGGAAVQRSRAAQTLLWGGATLLLISQSAYVNGRILVGQLIGEGRTFAAQYDSRDLQHLADMKNRLPPFRVATVEDYYQKPSWLWAYGLETSDGYINLYPKRYREFWEQVIAPLAAKRRDAYNKLHYWGNQLYLFAPPSSSIAFDQFYRLPLLSLANTRFIVSRVPLEHHDLILVPPITDVERDGWDEIRESVATVRRGGPARRGKLRIYENRSVMPRYFVVTRARVFHGSAQLLEALRNSTTEDLRTYAYVSQADSAGVPLGELSGGGREAPVEPEISSASADRITLVVSTPSPAILVAANSYSPYWQASVDGASLPLFPVDHTFQGVRLDAGHHAVELRYCPPYAFGSRCSSSP
ncbi:MAG: DUF6044 family protein [Vicinamibacterales bacterium]